MSSIFSIPLFSKLPFKRNPVYLPLVDTNRKYISDQSDGEDPEPIQSMRQSVLFDAVLGQGGPRKV